MGRTDRLVAWSRDHAPAVDALTALAALLVELAAGGSGDFYGLLFQGGWVMSVAWSVALTLPLVLRRSRPQTAALLFAGIAFAQLAVGPELLLADALALVMVYSVVAHGDPRHTRPFIGLAFGMGALAALVIVWADMAGPLVGRGDEGIGLCPSAWHGELTSSCISTARSDLVSASMIIGACLLSAVSVGYWQRARTSTLRLLRERNEALVAGEHERTRNAALAERARIARDMHDVVAHTLSIVIAQADGGRYAGTHDPAVARRTMLTIRREAEHAVHDMTTLLGVFGGAGDADWTKTGELVEQARSVGGTTIGRTLEGTPAPERLDAQASRAMYRMLQEALTNARRYAGAEATVTVREIWSDGGLRVIVDDDGLGSGSGCDGHRPGYGLVGMRERVRSVHGTLSAGARGTDGRGGFEVDAFVPFADAEGIPPSDAPTRTGALPSTVTMQGPGGNGSNGRNATDGSGPLPVIGLLRIIGARVMSGIAARRRTDERAEPHDEPTDGAATARRRRRDCWNRVRGNRIERLSRWAQSHYLAADVLMTLAVMTVMCSEPFAQTVILGNPAAAASGSESDLTLIRVMTVATLAPLTVRRRWPEGAAAAMAAICALQLVFCSPLLLVHMSALVSLHAANLYGRRTAWRWTSLAAGADSVLVAAKIVAFSDESDTLVHALSSMLGGGAATPDARDLVGALVWTIVMAVLCLGVMALALWQRSTGSNALVLRARREALESEQKQRSLLAANTERERIGSAIRSEVRSTLDGVISRTDAGLGLLDEAESAKGVPNPADVAAAFEDIAEQGRDALARMRRLLAVLRETDAGSSDDPTMRLHPTVPIADQLREAARPADRIGGHE